MIIQLSQEEKEGVWSAGQIQSEQEEQVSENLGTTLSPCHRNSNPQTMCSCKPEELGDSSRVPVVSVGGRMVWRELAVRNGYHLTYSLGSDTVMLQQT